MSNRPPVRESRSVRLRDDEWILAEAIARMYGERSAGFGLRAALAREETRLRRDKVRAAELSRLLRVIETERAEGDR